MSYTEQDLSKLIGEVEKEFTAHLAKAEEASLAKSETANAEAAQAETAKVEEKSDTAEVTLAKAEHEKKEKEEECDYDEKDHEEMHKMYKSMSKGERKAHLNAISKCGEIAMEKSEQDTTVKIDAPAAEAVKEIELLKSEFSAQLEAEKAKNAELKKNLDGVQEFLTKLGKKIAPQGKAITNLDTIAKSEEGKEEEKSLTKSEINSRLAKKAAEPSLAKCDRDAINAFYLQGANINTVSHLLK